MDRQENNDTQHVIDVERVGVIGVERVGVASSSGSSNSNSLPRLDRLEHEERPSSNIRIPVSQSLPSVSNVSNSRSPRVTRRGDVNGNGRRRRSPLNSKLWITTESVFTVCQIIASIVVLSVSRHEKPHAPLFSWVVGYASGCVVSLPLLYWRYLHRNQSSQQDSRQSHQGSSQFNRPERDTRTSVSRPSEEQNRRSTVRTTWIHQNFGGLTERRLIALVDHLRMALDCFFAVWFVVGNVWIFGRHSSAAVAPKLYILCVVFLTFSCIGYAMPFLLCATICCCFPCIISFLGFHEDLPLTRGAGPESITVLPTYKFKLKKKSNGGRDREINSEAVGEGGIFAPGTEKEREISGEDAVCCICLAKYDDNDDLRELPCSHFFHVECVDKWLKINASCPLCKSEVGESSGNSSSAANSSRLHVGRRVFDGLAGRDAYGSTLF